MASLLRAYNRLVVVVVLSCLCTPVLASSTATATTAPAPAIYGYDGSVLNAQVASASALRARVATSGEAPTNARSTSSPLGFADVLAAKAGATLDDLAASAQASARGGQTAAGRALQKHADRAGSIYPKIGSPAERSRVAQEIVEDYLTNPQIRERVRRDGVRIFEMPNGRGVSYNKNGSFRGFLEPYR